MQLPIEAVRRVTAYYTVPGEPVAKSFTFEQGRINLIADDLLGRLLAREAVEALFLDGTLRILESDEANAKVAGLTPFAAPEVLAAQAAAEAYARAKDGVADPSTELKEITAREAALRAADKAKIVEFKPGPKKPREHGIAYDEDEVEARRS